MADGFDGGNNVATEIQLSKRCKRVQPLNTSYIVSSKIQYTQFCQSSQTFHAIDAIGVEVEHVEVMEAVKAFKLTRQGLV